MKNSETPDMLKATTLLRSGENPFDNYSTPSKKDVASRNSKNNMPTSARDYNELLYSSNDGYKIS
jgi:hypothetical protein